MLGFANFTGGVAPWVVRLLSGSSGKTARRLVAMLVPSHEILLASRSGNIVDGISAVKFNWVDSSTYANPFAHLQARKSPIKAIYLVNQPGNMTPLKIMKPFIDIAISHGVTRFVLLSACREDETTPGTGQVHAYLKNLGVEWAVLRPTFFMENFSEQQHLPTIRDQSCIFSATGDGKISFVSAEDIAAVAYRALVDTKPHNCDYLIVGPELFSHDEVAALFTKILGREIRHIKLSQDQLVENFTSFGINEVYARRLCEGESRASRDEFAILNEVVAQVTERAPMTLRQYIEKHKNAWE